MGGPAGAGLLHQATEKAMTTTNAQSNHTKNELLRELVIVIAFLAMLLSGVGALYWMQTRPDEAAAGAGAPPPEVALPTRGAIGVHAAVYFDFKSARLPADAPKMLLGKAAALSRTDTSGVLVTG